MVSSPGLAGSLAASAAEAVVTLPLGLSVVTAIVYVDLTVPGAKALSVEGERVDRIELQARYGGESETVYVLRSGRRVTAVR